MLAPLAQDNVTCLSPPGFGAPLPANFGATMVEYRDWLIEQLEAFGEPVDLVGHDWGGGHAVNVAMTRPDLLHSWASDAIGLFDPGYVWHDLAQQWQTPGIGEASVANLFGGTAQDRTATMIGLGIAQPVAQRLAAGQNQQMGQAVLALYRSAAQPVLAEAGRALESASARPGLVIIAGADQQVGSTSIRRRAAARAGARVAVLDGLGHWWMVQDPHLAARTLRDFWEQTA